ncbi:sensor histidine kinase [Leptospira semungkisensis]|uniref:histidine kinase n=1 Tax=Leptospira semungkisensis TaxID=2484985 RepID=A0A4R9FLN0_9LEPT|nr:sensor histidine kinase [Leptospira semungkisensis]TGJ99565.1 sensor histidine kinase [Leptospira semungkisensis]
MNPVALMNAIAFVLYSSSIFLLLRSIRRHLILPGPAIFAVASLSTGVFLSISNFLEHSGISDLLDDYEGFARDLFVMFLLIFLYVDSMHREQVKREDDQKRIQNELREKAFLLTEIHHRVNNNLQIVSGLLSLQRESQGTGKISDALRIAQNRILSIAKIHQIIYDSQNLLQIGVDSILGSVIQNLTTAYQNESTRILVKSEMDKNIKLDPERAMPLGLILNELVTNSLKHAYCDGEAGEISVRLEQDAGNIILSVSDSGKGLPSAEAEDTGIGMKLVESLVQQIRGRVKVDSKEGTSIRIILPKEGVSSLIFFRP